MLRLLHSQVPQQLNSKGGTCSGSRVWVVHRHRKQQLGQHHLRTATSPSEASFTPDRKLCRPGVNLQAKAATLEQVAETGPEEQAAALQQMAASSSPDVVRAALQGRPPPALVVFSGGTAFNSVAGHMKSLTTQVTHVLPVSDDGGSTAEIVRVLGGPAVGDIRSRCLRLADDSNEEAQAVRRLLAHRLAAGSAEEAKREWYDIVEGEHGLWRGVSEPYKHTIRAFLVHFHVNILRHSTERFRFQNGSVGNFFFAGARIFFRSLEAAIFLFSRVARLPEGSLVLPAICTEARITLGAQLCSGSVLVGQNEISHPTAADTPRAHNTVDKAGLGPPMESPIRHIFYLSSEGTNQEHEVFPLVNPRVVAEIQRADALVYGMGSLYTSICPSLILQGAGEAVAARHIPKILLLNGCHDRETALCGAHSGPMTAADVVQTICDTLNRRHTPRRLPLCETIPAYITHVLYPRDGSIEVDAQALTKLGIEQTQEVDSSTDSQGMVVFDPEALVEAISGVVLGASKQDALQ